MKTFSLNGRAALVTGSSQGLGLAIAAGLRESGALVVHHGHQPVAPEEVPVDVPYVCADLFEKESPQRLVDAAFDHAPQLDLLVCNAGSFLDLPPLEMTPAHWERTLQLNVTSAFFTAQAFAQRLVSEQRGGAVVITTSTNGFQAEMDSVAYDTSKGALVMMIRSLAVSFAVHGIRVNGIAPGLIRTPLTNEWMTTRAHDLIPHYERSIPLARIGNPEDVAGAAAFLCSDAASYITGEIIRIDGGLTVSQVGRLP